ncbi:hypothetical protein [Clostridium vincentii]|uniref:Uncharacterized protein n=1 Tax=Clostridium vincentii TaxID=52704 RepID=A0A2T0BEN3_9CLOT|nr:hypothetical protein [Clostridium vincentii]PRR82344.1 hypothetical protein CLVI_18500 [Clostridium vincentii]
MNYITPVNSYLVLMPSGNIRGFKDVDHARGLIQEYYLKKTLSSIHNGEEGSQDMHEDFNDIGIVAGVEDGECQIYNLDDFMDKIRNSDIFQEEKDELISELLKENIKLNVYDYGVYDLLSDVDVELS